MGKEKEKEVNVDTPDLAKEKTTQRPKTTSESIDTQKKRNYRKRKSSDSKTRLSEGEIEDSDEEINRVNLDDIRMAKRNKQEENIDADSDFSIDESSDDEGNSEEVSQKNKEKKLSKNDTIKTNTIEKENAGRDKSPKPEKQELKENKETIVPKPKVDIWKKRTVGPVFDEALKRYYERKSARGC